MTLALACTRCGRDVPPGTPEPQVEKDDEDGDVVVVNIAVPPGFFPADELPPALVCVACATDQEINTWVMADAA